MLAFSFDNDREQAQIGIDEVGRGCLMGPVVACAVMWDTKWLMDNEQRYHKELSSIKDSKRLSKKKRDEICTFIKTHAVYAVGDISSERIDTVNILNATHEAMHCCIHSLKERGIVMDRLLIDGHSFKPFDNIPYTCIKSGDNKYLSIASASIIAKVFRDNYIEKLCRDMPVLNDNYDWLNNKGYGTKKHLAGLTVHGVSEYHRRTFAPCKHFVSN